RLWNVARSQGDIADEDNATSLAESTQSSNLTGRWRFNASLGQFDKDLSSINNTAHLGVTGGSTAELTDPLRIADQACTNARIGFFSNHASSSTASYMAVEAYPNPFTETVNLTASGLMSGNATVVVSD